ncbi:cyclin-dependent protein kinase inhibitor SMR4 [Diospyros lotus]|uniref:cyclin-dependent protein kinase inhibitor SMR4 n=1 Tax=Diospyros lotus TaxID=55363 RepID=UPI00225122D9|nr:cyclin-dependent protein kinase inhibitor SMR4 [Diospyros lotus]
MEIGREVEAADEEDYCTTPKHKESRIPAASECPPAPKKKKSSSRIKREPPKSGYFHPPDLEALFAVGRRAESCL